jgi:hypothetical protein
MTKTAPVLIQPMNLRPPQLAALYGSQVLVDDVVRRGLLKPWRQGKRCTFYDYNEAVLAMVRYRKAIAEEGVRR